MMFAKFLQNRLKILWKNLVKLLSEKLYLNYKALSSFRKFFKKAAKLIFFSKATQAIAEAASEGVFQKR